jgi:hypothetical protein
MKIKEILEAFVNTRTGKAVFKKTNADSPSIGAFVDKVASKLEIPRDELFTKVSEDYSISKLEILSVYSPALYKTMAENAVESAAFRIIKQDVANPESTLIGLRFSWPLFVKLCKQITLEHSSALGNGDMFPLKRQGDPRVIHGVNPIAIPATSKNLLKFNDVETAAATAKGEFLFNVNFMQGLITYGELIDVKPSGKKYQSNGGFYPDPYCYLEFLILHEIMHYTHNDFEVSQRLPQYSDTSHNWASDFRSNYLLVKSGYEQIPIGLFSEELTTMSPDIRSYRRLIEKVQEEMDKIPDELKDFIDTHLGNDDHTGDFEPWVPKIGDEVELLDGSEKGEIVDILPDGTAIIGPLVNKIGG